MEGQRINEMKGKEKIKRGQEATMKIVE